MFWRRNDPARRPLPSGLRLRCEGVLSLELRARRQDAMAADDAVLGSFGYETTEAWGDGQFWTDAPPDPAWAWCFEFESGSALVVKGSEAYVCLVP